jgi:hypothetical protein
VSHAELSESRWGSGRRMRNMERVLLTNRETGCHYPHARSESRACDTPPRACFSTPVGLCVARVATLAPHDGGFRIQYEKISSHRNVKLCTTCTITRKA